jgi:hypothetical protein
MIESSIVLVRRWRCRLASCIFFSLVILLKCNCASAFLASPFVTTSSGFRHTGMGGPFPMTHARIRSVRGQRNGLSSALTCSTKDSTSSPSTKSTKTKETKPAKGIKRRTLSLMVPTSPRMALRYIICLCFLILGRVANVMVSRALPLCHGCIFLVVIQECVS